MSYDTLLIDTCDIKRYTPGVQDAYGNPAKTWANLHTDIACRLVDGGGKEVKIGAEVVIADFKLFLGDVDVTEQDRAVVDAETYEIILVQSHGDQYGYHHKEVYLRRVR